MSLRVLFVFLIVIIGLNFTNSCQEDSVDNVSTRYKDIECCTWFEYHFKFQKCCCSWLIGDEGAYFSPKLSKGFTHGKDVIWTCYDCKFGKRC